MMHSARRAHRLSRCLTLFFIGSCHPLRSIYGKKGKTKAMQWRGKGEGWVDELALTIPVRLGDLVGLGGE